MKTNKTFRKIASVATASIIAACAAVPMMSFNASAASIVIENAGYGYTYTAYQIFDGDYDTTSKKLSNIVWGSGINGDSALAEIKKIALADASTPFSNCTNAADVADVLAAKYGGVENSEIAKKFASTVSDFLTATGTSSGAIDTANSQYKIDNLDPGYYLVKNTAVDGATSELFFTEYIVEVVGDETKVEAKGDFPTLEKTVLDVNDTENTSEAFGDYADHDIGDTVTFRLEATVASNFAAYTNGIKYVFHDTLASGLNYNAVSSVKLYKDSSDTTGTAINDFTATDNSGKLDITVNNIKSYGDLTADSKIVVEYTAILDTDATIGTDGINTNKAYLEYTNNPYGSDTGKTPQDEAYVYTYDVVINKVDSDSKELKGADFTLYKYNGATSSWDEVTRKDTVTEDTTTFTFNGIDDGRYKLVESKTPTGYNTMKELYFTVQPDQDSTTPLSKIDVTITDKDGVADANATVSLAGNAATGIISGNIINNQGATLPSTGGIGTTPFFVGGGVLVVGAGVYLIVRKRMKSNNDK